ncbi:MAG: class I SAM-dependent methyltransferase [Oscillospiraceae bacterium]|nr:class I SAM-dependent methyltransferase [Oscillospiraceae bacterium]
MIDLRDLRRRLIIPHVGSIAVDYTMGNGHDTLMLAELFECVYAFDIQEKALENTGKLLSEHNYLDKCTLILDSHSNAKKYITEPVNAGIFNLGYLPGGDKTLTTRAETTIKAVEAAVDLMADGGIVFIAVYPGHEEGKLEGELLEKKYAELDRRNYCFSSFKILNSPSSPYFLIIERK